MTSRLTRHELTDDDTGVWIVHTRSGSAYRFDLDARTIERVAGEPRRPAAPADSLQSLRAIIELRVGLPGRWWMRNRSGGYVDPDQVWQWSSVVAAIEQATDDPPQESKLSTDGGSRQ
ncbi:hypothetical protein [Leifsonia shinshuensis]|uniref:Uncharacterized protein n=1 Tax=Leifsonia shinshuensis TaxID=150026 RepID=A0A7G6YBL0_9MICO|nr:hypothetical protein [Leifsonia shinshuensis]QNE35875.1 hypothetical protein F1C12_12555 [Leifsonia shinshuensis]